MLANELTHLVDDEGNASHSYGLCDGEYVPFVRAHLLAVIGSVDENKLDIAGNDANKAGADFYRGVRMKDLS